MITDQDRAASPSLCTYGHVTPRQGFPRRRGLQGGHVDARTTSPFIIKVILVDDEHLCCLNPFDRFCFRSHKLVKRLPFSCPLKPELIIPIVALTLEDLIKLDLWQATPLVTGQHTPCSDV